jgi:hypothetical protein
MKIHSHFFNAQKNILKKRGLAGFLYIVNILFAIALTIPMSESLNALATTALADEMIDGFFLDRFFDYWQQFSDVYMAMGIVILVFAGFYVLLNTFFAGGILAILAREPAFSFREFMYASVTYFGRNFRLFLLSLPVLFAFLVFFFFAILNPLSQYAESLNPDAANRVAILILLLGVVFMGIWNMLFDYGKIAIFEHNKKSAIASFVKGAGFALRKFPKAAMLYFLNFGILCVLFLGYFAIESLFANDTLLQTYTLLVIQQIFIISRIWMKVSFFASQQHFYTYSPAPKSSTLHELFVTPKAG